MDLGYLVAVLAGIAILTAAVASRVGKGTAPVVFLLVFSTFSGYLNNLYDRQPLIHVARFAVLALIAAIWLLSRRDRRGVPGGSRTPIDRLVWWFFAFYTLQMLNPHWSGPRAAILNGLIGLAQHGFPILLFFIGREIVRTPRQIASIFLLLIALSTLMAFYGLYQYHKGYEYVASLGAGFRATIHREMLWRTDDFEAKIFRPVSFASDAGTASSFYSVGILLAGALLTGGRLPRFQQVLLVGSVLVQFLALALTLVRSSMVGTLLGLGIIVMLGRRSRRVGLAIAGLGLLVAMIEDPTGGTMTERFKSSFDPTEIQRSRGKQIEAIWWAATTFPTGMGIGRAGPAAGRFNAPEDNRYSVPPESYYVGIAFETGIAGLLTVALIFYRLLRYCLVAVMRVRDPELHPLALACAVVLCAAMLVSFVGATLYSAPLCYLFWTLAGLLFRVIELEVARRRERAELAARKA